MLKEILSRIQEPGNKNYRFDNCFQRLFELKETQTWKDLILKIKRSSARKPFVKDCFDMLQDKFDYKRYKELIQADGSYKIIINYFGSSVDRDQQQLLQEIISLYFITETYIGFMVEYLIAEELKKKKIRFHQNKILDLKYKTDLLVDGKHLQIKNISFLETSRLEKKIKPYIDANRRLKFVFYKINQDNISLVRIGGKAFYQVQDLNDFTQLLPIEEITIEEFITDIRNN